MKIFNQYIAAASMMLVSGLAMSQTPATIPASMEGTYKVTFNRMVNYGVLPDGTELTMVIAPGGGLCLAQYIVGNPEIRDGSPYEAVWTVPNLGLDLFVSDLERGFNEVNVRQIDNGPLLAQLTGEKISNSTRCDLLGDTPPPMSDVVNIFKEAQSLYTDYFPFGGRPNFAFQIQDQQIVREYRSSGMTIAISGNQVFLRGKEYGNSLVSVGSLNEVAQIMTQERAHRDGISNPPDDSSGPNNPGPDIPQGDYELTISGTVAAVVFGTSTSAPFSLTIDSIEAPSSSDVDALENEVKEALANADGVDASTFTNFTISEVSVTDSRVFFRAQFSATTVTSGITVNQSYNLTYEYIKK